MITQYLNMTIIGALAGVVITTLIYTLRLLSLGQQKLKDDQLKAVQDDLQKVKDAVNAEPLSELVDEANKRHSSNK